jgi:putative ABC transport system substrate-binding protein
LNPEVIVTHATQGTLLLQRATRAIPIVTAAVTDPLGNGFATSLARPGGNITGLSLIVGDISPKHVEFLKAVLPELSLLAILVNPDNPSHPPVLKSIQVAAQQARISVLAVASRGDVEGIEQAFATIAKQRAQVVVIASDSFFVGQRRRIVEAAAKYRIPTMFAFRQEVEAGGLLSYGQNPAEFFRRAASYVDKILKGAKPGDLPIEQPTNFELVINLKTAKALGITIPQSLLVRADELIR